MIGTVTGSEIRKNRDGTQNVVVLQVVMNDPDDVQNVELFPTPGKDYRPLPGSKVIVMDGAGAAYKIAITGRDEIEPSAAVGEQKVYSVNAAGLVQAIIHWMEDGQLVLNAGGGTAVEYKRLQTAFNQLQADFDNHTHSVEAPLGNVADSDGGPCTGSTAPPEATSTADITISESPTVNLP